MFAASIIRSAMSVAASLSAGYALLLAILTISHVQTHVIYLHKVTLTWFQDVDQPERWGFLPNQVTTFFLETPDKKRLHAWHILPIGLYQQHEAELLTQTAGSAPDVSETLSFKLLRDDPESLLVLFFHGAGGTLGSGWRPPGYRAMHALDSKRIHTVAIDYRGFGKSSGYPTEHGLLIDAETLLRWAVNEAKIPPSRIVIFGQSLGTAVALSLAHEVTVKSPEPTFVKGMVLAEPFADVAELTSTYSIAGMFPLLGPLSNFPVLHKFFKSLLICKWPSRERLAELIASIERSEAGQYDITIIHTKDDWDVPWSHSELLFWHAVDTNLPKDTTAKQIKEAILREKKQLGSDGWMLQRRTEHGVLRQEIVEYGLHDRIMSYPRVSLAVWRAFQET